LLSFHFFFIHSNSFILSKKLTFKAFTYFILYFLIFSGLKKLRNATLRAAGMELPTARVGAGASPGRARGGASPGRTRGGASPGRMGPPRESPPAKRMRNTSAEEEAEMRRPLDFIRLLFASAQACDLLRTKFEHHLHTFFEVLFKSEKIWKIIKNS
jgi:hypothetical protein